MDAVVYWLTIVLRLTAVRTTSAILSLCGKTKNKSDHIRKFYFERTCLFYKSKPLSWSLVLYLIVMRATVSLYEHPDLSDSEIWPSGSAGIKSGCTVVVLGVISIAAASTLAAVQYTNLVSPRWVLDFFDGFAVIYREAGSDDSSGWFVWGYSSSDRLAASRVISQPVIERLLF